MHEFPYSWNPNDILNIVQPRKSDSALFLVITEDQFQAFAKKKIDGTLGTAK